MKIFKLILLSLAVLCGSSIATELAAESTRLDAILERGVIHVGTTGDYQPFSFLNPETGQFEGYDIDAARDLGEALGVEVRFVETTWKTLVPGILEGKYDIAMCGITRTPARLKRVGLSDSYFAVGKSPLVRKADRERFRMLVDIDHPGVKIGVNPGGTNERFVRANITRAQIVVIPDNLEIPHKIITGEVDVMITDNVEAMLVARDRPELYAVSPEHTFTNDEFGYMVPIEAVSFLNRINLWIRQMKQTGQFTRLKEKWIGE